MKKKQTNKYERLLHDLEMKLTGSTNYFMDKSLTTGKFINHLFRHAISPFKRRGWFGYCSECGKFSKGLAKETIDFDYDEDEEGTHTCLIYGMVCKSCKGKLEKEEEYGK